MNDENRIDPGHNRPRNVLRKAGPIVLGSGILLTVVGFGSLIVAIATDGMPILFFLAFIGLPLTFVGTVMTFAGYMGKIARYTQAESAPAQPVLRAKQRSAATNATMCRQRTPSSATVAVQRWKRTNPVPFAAN